MTGWIALLALIVSLAIWGMRRATTDAAFFAASRSVGVVVAGLGGTAAGLSAFVFVGGPGLFATIGIASLWLVLSAPLTGALQCWTVGERIVDLARRRDCLTVPDLVEARFGPGLPAGLTALAVAIGGVATLAVQIKGCAILGESLLGLPGWQVALAAMAATTAYATAGGMRAGVVAEAAQGVIMAVSAIWLAWGTLAAAGGPAAAIDTVAANRPDLLEAFTVGGIGPSLSMLLLFGLGTCAQPHYLQKFLLLRDRRSLRWMPAVMTVALLAVLTVWLGVGLGGTALWLGGALHVDSTDQIAPVVLASLGRPELRFVAALAVVAAVMSTAASLLNLVAAAVSRDLPRAMGLRRPLGLIGPRLATVAAAVASVVLALASDRPVAWLGILGWGCFTAALLPVMTIGLAWRGVTRSGAIAALVAGPLTQIALESARVAGTPITGFEPGLTGAAVGCLALVTASAVTSRATSQVTP